MNWKISSDNAAAVSTVEYWQPMTSCPTLIKVQLLGKGMVATYGAWDGKNDFWIGWAAIPKIPDWMK